MPRAALRAGGLLLVGIREQDILFKGNISSTDAHNMHTLYFKMPSASLSAANAVRTAPRFQVTCAQQQPAKSPQLSRRQAFQTLGGALLSIAATTGLARAEDQAEVGIPSPSTPAPADQASHFRSGPAHLPLNLASAHSQIF